MKEARECAVLGDKEVFLLDRNVGPRRAAVETWKQRPDLRMLLDSRQTETQFSVLRRTERMFAQTFICLTNM